jgi:MFS family permease
MNKKYLSVLACFNLSFHWFTIGIIIPVMTLFLLEKGMTLVQIGVIFAGYATATVVLELPTGGLADAIGRKKVYLSALVLQMIAGILLIFLNGFPALFFCSLLQGASRSLSSGTMDAHFIDEFYRIDPEVNLQKQMAKIGIFIPMALGLASLIGGFLPMTLGVYTESSFLKNAYTANYIIFVLVVFIQFLCTLILVKEEKREGKENTLIGGFKRFPLILSTSVQFGLKHPVILLLLLSGFAWGFSISGLEQLWQPQVKSILGPDSASWVYGVLTCGYFMADSLGNVIVTPICRIFRNNYSKVLFGGRLLMGIFYFILALQSGILIFSLFYISLFMFNGIQGSPESSLFNSEVPSDKRSTLLSFASLFMQAGGILGSLINAFIAQTFSIKAAWIVASIVITLSALLYLFIPVHEEQKKGDLSNEF